MANSSDSSKPSSHVPGAPRVPTVTIHSSQPAPPSAPPAGEHAQALAVDPGTLALLETLGGLLHTQEPSATLTRCVQIAHEVIQAVHSGRTLHFIDQSGDTDRLIIPGLPPRTGPP